MPVSEQYPALYNIARDKNNTITHVLSSSPPNISSRRDFIGPRLLSWHNLLSRLDSINLTQGQDVFRWNLTTSASFTVDSMYRALTHSEVAVSNNKKIWKSKIPLKVKIFMWYLLGELCSPKTMMQVCTFYVVSRPDSVKFVSAHNCCQCIQSVVGRYSK